MAQSVARQAVNLQVAGSNPAGPTTQITLLGSVFLLEQWFFLQQAFWASVSDVIALSLRSGQ